MSKISDPQFGFPISKAMEARHYTFLFLITGIYLLFELAFNARLLDVVGSTLDREVVDQIEFFGRIISGIALTLVFWPKVMKWSIARGQSIIKMALIMALTLITCCGVSYTLQEGILRGITLASSAAQKRAAATLVTLTGAVHTESVVLSGLPMDTVDFSSPEGKTFLAIFPALALSTNNLEEKTENELTQVVRYNTEHAIGGPSHLFNSVYLPTEAGIKEMFNTYLKISEPHYKAVQAIADQQAQAYRKYRNGLGKYTPTTLPRRYYNRVRSNLKKEGVYVSSNWHPTDKKGFYDAIEKSARYRIDPEYNQQMVQHLGRTLPSDLTFTTFVQHNGIQDRWRGKMGISEFIPLQTDWSFDQFKKHFYEPLISKTVQKEVTKLLAPVDTFEIGERNYQIGSDAIRAAYIPLIAFIFSTLGAFVHVFKTVWFGLLIFIRRKTYIAKGVLVAFAATVIVGWAVPAATTTNPVSQSLLYTKLEEDTVEKAGASLAMAMRSLVQAQTKFYPVSEAIRTKLLFGIRYEYSIH